MHYLANIAVALNQLVIAKIVGAAVSVYAAYGSKLASIVLLIFYVVVIANNLAVLNKQGH